jgi:hypothetical protein
MARPKSEKPTKTVIKSVRLTHDQHEKLIKQYGTIQKALEYLATQLN